MTEAAGPAPLRVLWLDEDIVAVSKPSGLLVHRTAHAPEAVPLLQRLRDQLGRFLFPIQRLDRSTSGLVVFAFSRPAAARLQEHLQAPDARKLYLALVRGTVPEAWVSERPLTDEGVARPARTAFRRLAQFDRCALVEAALDTGRWHQIRRHLAHAAHHVLGDTSHGKGRDNRFFRAERGLRRLFLHAHRVSFRHPIGEVRVELHDPLASELLAVLAQIPDCPESVRVALAAGADPPGASPFAG